MNIKERVSLAPFTTFHIGGPARIFVETRNEGEIKDAVIYAREHDLKIYPLGAGSNLLVPDTGVKGLIVKIAFDDIEFENNGEQTLLIAGAGTPWKKIVDTASERNLFGVENLAGIPGTIGGASVQNICAYGAELSGVFEYADTIDMTTGASKRINKTEAAFGYRMSFFKAHRAFIIVRVALRLSEKATLNISYPDLVRIQETGTPLTTPSEIAQAVCAIRANKFPFSPEEGTAGSFFKNPVISRELADSLALRFPDLPSFPQKDGRVKVPLAWILDRVLSIKGFSKGYVRLYEKQPLVIVARAGATAAEVNEFANEVASRVFDATGITIEREVETFGAME